MDHVVTKINLYGVIQKHHMLQRKFGMSMTSKDKESTKKHEITEIILGIQGVR